MKYRVMITLYLDVRPKQVFEIQNMNSYDGMQIIEKRKRKYLPYAETKPVTL